MKTCARTIALAIILSLVVGDIDFASQKIGFAWLGFNSQAHARVGRPATPVSAAGVARRTTRRVIGPAVFELSPTADDVRSFR